ncbi:MAG: GldG family protein [Ruminococcus sp.]|nr:GldG family protein [Ruminococcus sp.]MDD5889218.1 GldG family protein [Ruminococcus sp.]
MFKKNKKEDFLATEIEKDIKADETSTDEVTGKEETSDVEVKKQSKVKKILHSRKFSKGWLSIAIIAIFLACVVAVNIIASVMENKYPSLSVDITGSNLYQLQDDTKKLCKNVNKDIDIYLLDDENAFTSYDSLSTVPYFTQAIQFFKEIASLNKHITFKFEDTASNPSFAKKYSDLNLSTSGTGTVCVIDAGNGRYKGLSITDLFEFKTDSSTNNKVVSSSKVEQKVCTTLLALTSENAAKACFITSSGVGSEKTSSSGSTAYSALKKLLENQAYETTTVDLDSNSKVPSDCDILLFIAPTSDISEQALKKVTSFLDTAKKSNKTFVYVPAPMAIENGTPNMDSFLEEQGIKVESNWIYEQDNNYITSIAPSDHRLSTYDYDDSTFTDGIDSNTRVAMGDTWNITLTKGSSAKVLLKSSTKADLLPSDAQSIDDVKEGTGKALNGAVINQAEVSDGVNKNVVVIGSFYAISTDFLTGYTQFNNSKYFANLFNLLTINENEDIVITSADNDTSLGIQSESETLFPEILFRYIIPIGVLILGIVIWAVRRKK